MEFIVASCMYIVDRQLGGNRRMIDMAEALSASLYEFGRTYAKISKRLAMDIPVQDPVCLLYKVCNGLDLAKEDALLLYSRVSKYSVHPVFSLV